MFRYLAEVLSLTFLIIVLAFVLFHYIWLRRENYILPPSIRDTSLRSQDKDPSIEPNFFKFIKKMAKYIYCARKEIMIKEIGFEQTYYILFYRRFLGFFLVLTPLVLLFIFFWARYATQDIQIILQRLAAAKERVITRIDVISFAACIYSVAMLTMLIFVRAAVNVDNLREIMVTEDNSETRHTKEDLWFEMRTMKVHGVPSMDTNGKHLELLIHKLMKKHGISGRVEQVSIIPNINKTLRLVGKVETLNDK